ncbi:hypothetical protein J6590_053226 [Homalodisca vitripennis]|nr:hypothetical protein J6590_053226 [Homalodisca vitripennis]
MERGIPYDVRLFCWNPRIIQKIFVLAIYFLFVCNRVGVTPKKVTPGAARPRLSARSDPCWVDMKGLVTLSKHCEDEIECDLVLLSSRSNDYLNQNHAPHKDFYQDFKMMTDHRQDADMKIRWLQEDFLAMEIALLTINYFIQCIVGHLEKCTDPTPANIVNSLMSYVRKVTPCHQYERSTSRAGLTTVNSVLAFVAAALLLTKFH